MNCESIPVKEFLKECLVFPGQSWAGVTIELRPLEVVGQGQGEAGSQDQEAGKAVRGHSGLVRVIAPCQDQGQHGGSGNRYSTGWRVI